MRPSSSLPKNFSFTAVDIETANHRSGSICAIGIARVEEGVITDQYYHLIKPSPNFFTSNCVKVHGLTDSDCNNAPTFGEI